MDKTMDSKTSRQKRTKLLLASSLKELCRTKPLSKISIQDIVDNCGMTRNTFYYHFLDKQELINWIYRYECLEDLNRFQELLLAGQWDVVNLSVLENLEKSRDFYIKALKADGQNCFNDYMLEMATYIFDITITTVLGDRTIPAEFKAFLVTFYASAFTNVTIDWLKRGMPVPKEKIIEWFNLSTRHGLETLLSENLRP